MITGDEQREPLSDASKQV